LQQGSGAVSVFALQFDQVWAPGVIATTLDRRKGRAAPGAGGVRGDQLHRDHGLGWGRLRELNDGRGVDRVVEIGGPGTDREIVKSGRRRTCQSDRREPSPEGTMLDPLLLTGRGITVGAISVGSRADFEAMNRRL